MKVLILDGEDLLTFNVIKVLGMQRNMHITVASTSKNFIRFSRYCHSFIHHCNEGGAEKLNFLKNFANKQKGEEYILLAMGEEGVKFISKYTTELRERFIVPPYPKYDSLDIIFDKQSFADFLSEHQIVIPKTRPLDNKIQEEDLSFPVLIKPALGGFGGKGIKKIEDYGSLKAEVQTLEGKYLVQEFIKGQDYDLNAVVKDGEILAFTIQRDISKKRNGFVYSKNIEFIDDERVYGISKQMIEKLDYSGVLNIDLRYNEVEDNFMVIEINPRYWGTICGSYVSGINFPYLHCLLAQNGILEENNPPYNSVQYTDVFNYFHTIFDKRDRKMKDCYSTLFFHFRDPLPLLVLLGQKFYEKVVKAIVLIRKKKEKDDRIVVPRG